MNSEEQPNTHKPEDAEPEPSSGNGARNKSHRSDELYTVFYRWMLSAHALLSSRAPLVSLDYDITLTENGHSAMLGPARLDFMATVDACVGDLTAQPDFLALAELVFGAPELASGIRPVNTSPSMLTQEELSALWRVGRAFLLEYFTAHRDLLFDMKVFEQLYGRLEEYIFHPGPFETEWLLHLQNVSLEPDRVQLADGLALRKLTPDERIWLIKQDLRERRYTDLSRSDVLAIIEYQDMQEKWLSALQLPGPAFSAAHTVVLALRLLDSQPVGLMDYHWQPIDQPFLYFPRLVYYSNFGQSPIAKTGDTYLLTVGGADRLVALWPKLQRAQSDDLLNIARTRLADSYHRTRDEDRLIDYWIALESLFLPKKNLAQQAFFVSSALAHYVGTTVSERADIVNALVDSHGLRNAIVHGESGARAPDKITELVRRTGEYLRMALRKRIME